MFKNLKLKYPFLSIIAVIIVVCLIAIACKKKATEPSFTVEVEKVPGSRNAKTWRCNAFYGWRNVKAMYLNLVLIFTIAIIQNFIIFGRNSRRI